MIVLLYILSIVTQEQIYFEHKKYCLQRLKRLSAFNNNFGGEYGFNS